MDYMGFSF